MSEITTVSFLVPSDHALEFQTRAYAMLTELTGTAPEDPAAGFVPRSSREVQGTDVWSLPAWSDDDHDRAAWLAADLPAHPLAVLTYLCDNADAWISGAAIADELGLAHGAKSVPPSFKSMANRCRRAGRRPTWEYDNQNGYRVSSPVADLFRPALDAARQ